MKIGKKRGREDAMSMAAPAKVVPVPEKADKKSKKQKTLKVDEVLPSFAICFVQ